MVRIYVKLEKWANYQSDVLSMDHLQWGPSPFGMARTGGLHLLIKHTQKTLQSDCLFFQSVHVISHLLSECICHSASALKGGEKVSTSNVQIIRESKTASEIDGGVSH